MSLKQKTVKGIVWSFLEKWCNQLVSTTVFLILARLLGPEAFGLIALASVFIAFMTTFLQQGFAEAIIQREQLDPEHLDTAFWISLGTGITLTTIALAGAGLVAIGFSEPQLTPVIRWLSLNFLFTSLQSVQMAILRRRFAFRTLALRSSIATLVSGMVGVSMAFSGWGIWSLVGQQLTNGLVGVLVLWRGSDWQPGFSVSKSHFHQLFAFGSNVMGLNILKFFNRRSDDFLIGYYLGSVALGYYTVAYRLLLVMMNILTTTMTQVALPSFSRLQEDKNRLRHVFYSATQLTSLIAFPAFCTVLVLAPELVKVLFGEEWLTSIPVMQVLSLVGILQSVSYFNGTIMMAMGKPSWRLRINFLNAIVNVLAFLIAVRWGILAVAVAFVISGYLLSPLNLWAVYKLINIKISTYLQQYLAPLTGSILMAGTTLGTKFWLNNLGVSLQIQLFICLPIAGLAYALSILILAPELAKKAINFARLALPGKTN